MQTYVRSITDRALLGAHDMEPIPAVGDMIVVDSRHHARVISREWDPAAHAVTLVVLPPVAAPKEPDTSGTGSTATTSTGSGTGSPPVIG